MVNKLPECTIGQGFSGNLVDTYFKGGMAGHTGVDSTCAYGSDIHAYWGNEYVYKVLTKENPANDGSGFTGVFTIVDNGVECFEFLYGHCNPKVAVGQILARGEVLGTQGNNGEVYSPDGKGGFIRITLEMQKNGDTRGSHRHDQKRILKKVKMLASPSKVPPTRYLFGQDGSLFTQDGYYFEIPYYYNGFNGCVNWLLPLFNRDLFLGKSGYDVLCLQRFLKKGGYLQIDEPTEFFGSKTLGAVMAFQKANGISPIGGYVGKITRELINKSI